MLVLFLAEKDGIWGFLIVREKKKRELLNIRSNGLAGRGRAYGHQQSAKEGDKPNKKMWKRGEPENLNEERGRRVKTWYQKNSFCRKN